MLTFGSSIQEFRARDEVATSASKEAVAGQKFSQPEGILQLHCMSQQHSHKLLHLSQPTIDISTHFSGSAADSDNTAQSVHQYTQYMESGNSAALDGIDG